MHSPDVSVIVVNYNGRAWLRRCLTALGAQNGDACEIVVVDNGSSDDSVRVVRDEFPAVRLVILPHNCGFAAGNNAGAAASSRRLLAFLNNDTEPCAGWTRALQRGLAANPWASLATSRIVYMHDPRVIDSAGDGYSRVGAAFKHGHGQPADSALASREVFGVCGAAFMVGRHVFEDVGGFDEEFFAVYEDVDFSYRAQLLGYRCLYVADAVVIHAGSATLGRASREAVFYGQRNAEWVYFKNTPATILWRSLPGHVLYDLLAAAYFASIGMAGTFLAAKWAAARGAAGIWRKRLEVQRRRRTPPARLWKLMERRWFQLKWREKKFELDLARAK
jgi:GT2 family glycosyltransferase